MADRQMIECGDLRLVFEWRGDRYGHTVQQRIDRHWTPLLESVEGTGEDEWPPSPALQELHIERRATGAVALLVGRSGASHWSASVEALADGGVLFDVACRIHRSAQQLGSRYRLLSPKTAVTMTVAAKDAHTDVAKQNAAWTIEPATIRDSLPNTIRWQYEIRV